MDPGARLFREKLWELSRQLGMSIRVAHFPSYCSKYNPIDHRLFSHVTRSLKGIIFRSVQTVADAIARTTTSTGLRVKVEVMKRMYQRGVKASEEFLLGNFIRCDETLPKYNYKTIFLVDDSGCYSTTVAYSACLLPK